MKKRIFVTIIVVYLLAACNSNTASSHGNGTSSETIPAEFAGKTNPLGADAALAGATVFKDYCASCHGALGHGDGPAAASLVPPPKNLAELQSQVKDDYLLWRISDGKEGTAMVAWKGILTEEQIWQVITFIRTLK